MDTKTTEKTYIEFLELVNKALDIESLYQDTFQIIKNTFQADRVQIWEKIFNLDEISIYYEYFENNENSMLKFRMPSLPDSIKKSIEKTNMWEYQDISNELLNNHGINSLTGIEFRMPDQIKGILVLCFKDKNKKLTTSEISFLIKLKNRLEDGIYKVEKLSTSHEELKRLQNQNNRLRDQDRLRTNFINNISHELKTPLVSILGFSKMLINKQTSNISLKEIAEQIHLAASRLSSLITDFLQINKIDTEGWLAHCEPCDVGELIKTTVEEFVPLNKNHKISYKFSDNYPIIKTDPKLFRQVLDNILSNAIKYSPDGGTITISLNTTSDKEIKISISDQGLGINKEEIPKIFSRFYRSNNPNLQNISGSGLGLAICKEIIATLNGKIEVESELNKGSKFTFTLPAN